MSYARHPFTPDPLKWRVRIYNTTTGEFLLDEVFAGDETAMHRRSGDLWNAHCCMAPGRGWKLTTHRPGETRIYGTISG